MEKLSLNNTENLDNFEEKAAATAKEPSKKQKNLDFVLSNPLKTEITNSSISKNNEVEFEIEIMYKAEKWKLNKKLSEIISLIKNLKSENFAFLNEAYFLKNLDYYYEDLDLRDSALLSEINEQVKKLLNYVNYRYDVLLSSSAKDFFKVNEFSFNSEFTKILQAENLEQIFNFQIENSEMTLADFSYSPELGLLVLGLEDCSVLSTIGRFWSLIDYEVLGSVFFYQRVYDKNGKPFFRKIIAKSFDARVTKILLSLEQRKIYVGLDNGTIQVFQINVIEKVSISQNKNASSVSKSNSNDYNSSTANRRNSAEAEKNNYNSDEETHIKNENNKLLEIQNNNNNNNNNVNSNNNNNAEKDEKIIVINEGVIFKPLIERITGLDIYLNFLFISSKDNKLVILDVTHSKPELRFNGSLKKRMEGKGHIKEIFIDKKTKNLFVITVTDKVLIYKITVFSRNQSESQMDIKIEFTSEINTIDNIKNYFLGNYNLFIATENKIQVCDLKKLNNLSNSNNNINLNLNSNNNSNNTSNNLNSVNSSIYPAIGEDSNIIPFDGSLDDGISISSKFVSLDYAKGNYITAISYFCDMKLIILGLNNGNLIAVSSKSLEVIFAKKISENPIHKMILLEENYVVIISDDRGNVFFFQFGK